MAQGKYNNRFYVVSWSSRQKAIDALLHRGAIIQKTFESFYFVDAQNYLGNGVQVYMCNTSSKQIIPTSSDSLVGDVWKITGSYHDDDRILDLIPFERRNEYRVPKECI